MHTATPVASHRQARLAISPQGIFHERWPTRRVRATALALRRAARTVRPAVEYRTADRTHDVREAGRLPTRREKRRRRLLVATTAFDQRSQLKSPTFGIKHPRPHLERRLVAHVPLMPTGELGDPNVMLVPVETDDCALHFSTVRANGRIRGE